IALFTNVETKRKSKVYNSIAIFRTIGWIPGGIIAGLIYDAFPFNHRMGFLTPLIILIIGQFFLIFIFLKLLDVLHVQKYQKFVKQSIIKFPIFIILIPKTRCNSHG
ncbi:MAG: hypothetical protein ACTSP7_06190, partial [Candidatus Heimdallarchaeota archaeon]